MGRRRFAKNATEVRHFRLVSRSQNDHYANDADAPPLVLEAFAKPGDSRRTGLSDAELMLPPKGLLEKHPEAFVDPQAPVQDDFSLPENDENDLDGSDEEGNWEEELENDCYFPKDGYNYEKHLKQVSGTGKEKTGGAGVVLQAPVKVNEKEIKIQAAQTTEEQEIMRALECVDEYEEMADDDIDGIMPGGVLEEEVVIWGPTAAEERNLPDLAVFKAMHAARVGEQRKVSGCSDDFDDGSAELCDSHAAAQPRLKSAEQEAADAAEFEELFAAEYDDDSDAACEEEEIEGHLDLENVEEVLDEYLDDKRNEANKLKSVNEPIKGKLDNIPRVIGETKAIIEKYYLGDDDGAQTESGEESEDESRTWDCESVLSTLSNVSNRPGRIGKLQIIKKPVPAMKTVAENDKESEDDELDDVVELPDVVTERPKNETLEEKKQRKAGVKEMRRICRQMKKESKLTYKNEAASLPSSRAGNGDVRAKLRTFQM